MPADTRRLLDLLPPLLGVDTVTGGLRLAATFEDGVLVMPVMATEFRIPASSVDRIAERSTPLARAPATDALHQAAAALNIVRGRSILVAEYMTSGSGAPRLRWVDVSWPAASRPGPAYVA